jgi:topoisomerase IV subunit A
MHHTVKEIMKDHYLRYASYVILDRAIPDLADGLKPVQRRILHTLFKMQDGKFHKVANVAGQTMAYHPHGDAPIYEAIVTIANKGFLLDLQGNFGNPLTGDPAAAARYIETRLSKLALEAMFNPKLTEYVPSYDGRNEEPVILPAKIPLLLLQGAEGIAVGMATKIFPHNFQELIRAEIDLLEGKRGALYPDFPTGGLMDVSEYDNGKGKVRLRCTIEEKNAKTLVVREICYSTTTESVIASIEEAVKKGRIKIDSIHDYTAEKVEIEITLPRAVYAKDVINQLYAFTECEVSLQAQMVVIVDGFPKEITVSEALDYYVDRLQWCLRRELEIELGEVKDKLYDRTLERIFIEEKLYSLLETIEVFDQVFTVLDNAFLPFAKELHRAPIKADFEKLLQIPIRRIAKFDIKKHQEECAALGEREASLLRSLSNIKKVTIKYLEGVLKKFGEEFQRKTVIQNLEVLDRRSMEKKAVEIGVDMEGGYIGTKVAGSAKISCTNLDKILVLVSDGSYKVLSIEERAYVAKEGETIFYCGVADKEQVLTCFYRDKVSGVGFCKRFVVKQFIMEKEYRYVEEGCVPLLVTTEESPFMIHLVPMSRQKMAAFEVQPTKFLIKGVSAKGMRLNRRPVLSIEQRKNNARSVEKSTGE